MAVTILTDFGASERTAAIMEEAANKSINMAPALEEISVEMMLAEEALFRSQGRRGGGSWKRLKESTVKRKGNNKILMGTPDEALFKSLTERDAPYQILNITPTSIEFGTDRPWAASHQSGAPTANIPARPFLRFAPYDYAKWEKILLKYLMKPFETHASK